MDPLEDRIGHTQLSLAQLKIVQAVITLCVFVPFVLWYMRERLRSDFLWADFLWVGPFMCSCRCGATRQLLHIGSVRYHALLSPPALGLHDRANRDLAIVRGQA